MKATAVYFISALTAADTMHEYEHIVPSMEYEHIVPSMEYEHIVPSFFDFIKH